MLKLDADTRRFDPPQVVERLIVTPETASAWLERNTSNRKVTRHHVDKIARDMEGDRFEFTGDPIRFDVNGVLLDGQHRLMACVQASVPFDTLVVYNLPPEAQEKMDGGRARNASDVMSMGGHLYSTLLASACRTLIAERNATSKHIMTYTTSETLEALDRHPDLPAAVEHCASKKYPKAISVSSLAVVFYVGKHLLDKQQAAEDFVNVLRTGIPMYEGDAAHAFRERVILNGGTSAMTMKREEKWRLLKHAWNLFSAGQPAKILRGSADVSFNGVKPDRF